MKLEGRVIYKGTVEGYVLKCEESISFLGGVDAHTSKLNSGVCKDKELKDFIFMFNTAIGSTVGSYVIYALRYNNVAPKAFVCREADSIIATGAVMAEIPTIDKIDISIFENNDYVKLVNSAIFMDIEPTDVVTGIVTYHDKILILQRSDKVRTYKGKWAGVSGYLEPEDKMPEIRSLTEINEETGLKREDLKLLKKGKILYRRDGAHLWRIHTFLWQSSRADITIDWEHTQYRWIDVKDLQHYSTVPRLNDVILDLLEK